MTVRESLLIAAVFAGTWLAIGTEILSLFHALQFTFVMLWWLVPLPVLSVLAVRSLLLKPRLPQIRRPAGQWPLVAFNCMLLMTILGILAAAFVEARFSLPNNVDSLEYHLTRQVYWMQQGSVEHYPTSDLRELAMPPLTEYAGLHLMLLTGNDHLHNLIQWLAFALTMVTASHITRRYAAAQYSTTAQLLAALCVATIPIAFLQASNTKNDLVVAFGVSLLTYWILPWFDRVPLRWGQVALVGLAFGCLLLTKGTAFIFGLPLGALLVAALVIRHRAKSIGAVALIAVLVIALNGPFLYRNYKAFGSIVPNDPRIHGGQTLTMDDHSPGAMLSNVIRNLAPHLITPSAAWNQRLTQTVRYVHAILKIDINDARTTWLGSGLDAFRDYDFKWQNSEDRAAEPMQMALLLLLPLPIVLGWRQLRLQPILALLGIVLVQFLLFCFLLKWQYWHVRLVIAMPVLLAPVFAWVWTTPRLIFAAPLIAAALVAGLAPSINCATRPLWGPKSILHEDYNSTRYNDWPNLARNTVPIVRKIIAMQAKVIAFDTATGSRDYLIQRDILDRMSPPPRFTSFVPILAIPNYPSFPPDAVITYRKAPSFIVDPLTHIRYMRVGLPGARADGYALYVKGTNE